MSAFFHFQRTLNKLFNNLNKLYKVTLILDKFFLKYEVGVRLTPPPEKTTLKKPRLISVKSLTRSMDAHHFAVFFSSMQSIT